LNEAKGFAIIPKGNDDQNRFSSYCFEVTGAVRDVLKKAR
jgi:hypothetical protein